MSTLYLYPLNDFSVKIPLKDVDASGNIVPLTTGTVTAFFATSNSPTATTADGTLTTTATHIGGGKWLVQFDAAVLTAALLATLFASTLPYLIVQKPSGVRVYFDVIYAASRQGTVA
jgi:hypothetical protein